MNDAPVYWRKPGTLQVAVSEETDDDNNWMLEHLGYKPITHAQWKFYCALLSLKGKLKK